MADKIGGAALTKNVATVSNVTTPTNKTPQTYQSGGLTGGLTLHPAPQGANATTINNTDVSGVLQQIKAATSNLPAVSTFNANQYAKQVAKYKPGLLNNTIASLDPNTQQGVIAALEKLTRQDTQPAKIKGLAKTTSAADMVSPGTNGTKLNITDKVPYLKGDTGLESVGLPFDSVAGATKPNNAVKMTPDGQAPTENTNPGAGGGGGSGGGGGGSGGGGGYSSLLSQLSGGTGLGGLGGGVAAPYVPVAQAAGTNSPEAAAAYAQLLQNAGYDLTQPLSNVALPNRVALPEEVALPENFDFERMYNNLPEVNVGRINHVDTHPEEEMLGQITDLQSQQAVLNADNTVNNGITELQRVMQNAQDQYQAQRDQIAMDEQRAKDNQALYAEARGDRGGIGQAQYDTIQNTAATNRLTVQKEQTQLATDTARQIADLRAQGEFEKANQLLSISQKYLSELMDLYQWAKETNLGVDEFNLQVEQWEENFKLSLVGAELDAEAFNLNVANAKIDQANNRFNAAFNQENSLFDARLNAAKLQNDEALARLNAQLNAANATGAFANGTPTYAAQQDAIANQLKERSMLADIGTALIKAGIQPSNAILEAMAMGGTATGTEGGALAGSPLAGMDASSVLRAMGVGNSGFAALSAMGYTPESFLTESIGEGNTVAGLPALGSTPIAQASPGATVNDYASLYGLGGNDYDAMLNQLGAGYSYPNAQSEIAAYAQPTQASEVNPTLMDYYTAGQILKGNDYSSPVMTTASPLAASYGGAENLLRAAGIGDAGLAGLSYLGISPDMAVAQAFGY